VASTLVHRQAQAQVSLASASDRAAADRAQELTRQRWKDTALRVITSLLCFVLIAAATLVIAWWAAIPIALGPVVLCGGNLLVAFLVADLSTWVAGLVFLLLMVTLIVRDRGAGRRHA
jgi:hypothetical protein